MNYFVHQKTFVKHQFKIQQRKVLKQLTSGSNHLKHTKNTDFAS